MRCGNCHHFHPEEADQDRYENRCDSPGCSCTRWSLTRTSPDESLTATGAAPDRAEMVELVRAYARKQERLAASQLHPLHGRVENVAYMEDWRKQSKGDAA